MFVRCAGFVAGIFSLALGVASAQPDASRWQSAEIVTLTDTDKLDFLLGGGRTPVSPQAQEPKPRDKPGGVRLDRDGTPLPDAQARMGDRARTKTFRTELLTSSSRSTRETPYLAENRM